MFKLLKKVLQVGEATSRYPGQPVELAPGFRGKPVYDFDRCVACGACATACPPNAITMDHDPERGVVTWKLDYGRCIFCGRCEEVCPSGAIHLSGDFELASLAREDLYCTADMRLTRCAACGQYFAPRRQVQYTLSSLRQAGFADMDRWNRLLQECPRCRRREAVRVIPDPAPGAKSGRGGKRP